VAAKEVVAEVGCGEAEGAAGDLHLSRRYQAAGKAGQSTRLSSCRPRTSTC
jgi:hypothetical protein